DRQPSEFFACCIRTRDVYPYRRCVGGDRWRRDERIASVGFPRFGRGGIDRASISPSLKGRRANPTLPTGREKYRFPTKKLNQIKSPQAEIACSEDLAAFRPPRFL